MKKEKRVHRHRKGQPWKPQSKNSTQAHLIPQPPAVYQPEPFGAEKDADGSIASARYHVVHSYERSLLENVDDGISQIIDLRELTQYHPRLGAETSALGSVIDGVEALLQASNKWKRSEELDNGLAWFFQWLTVSDRNWSAGTTLQGVLFLLARATVHLRSVPSSDQLANKAEAAVKAHEAMNQVRAWLNRL